MPADSFTREQHELLIAHYERVAPLLVRSFGGTPFIAGFVPDWGTKRMVFEEGLREPPASIPTVQVTLGGGPIAFATVSENSLLWQAHRGAISYLGWSPTHEDPTRVAFGRVLLEPSGVATIAMVKEAAVLLRALLQSYGLQCMVLLGGFAGAALWIPFSDAPGYGPVRLRLDEFADEAARAHPALLTAAHPLAERGDRVHIATSSNAVGRYSALPYTLRALDALPVVAPIAWEEFDALDPGTVTAADFIARLAAKGDVFAGQVTSIGAQSSASFIASGQGGGGASASTFSRSTASRAGESSKPRSRFSTTVSRAMLTSCARNRSRAGSFPIRQRVKTSTPS